MFERRLRIFLAILFLGGLILIARAAQIQVVEGGAWAERAKASAERLAFLTPERGKIVDVHGLVLAEDVPAFQACVNYRAIPPDGPDAEWLESEATRRARSDAAYKTLDKKARAGAVERERANVLADLDKMWDLLARVSGQSRDEIDDTRREIARDVAAKHEAVWRANYRQALDAYAQLPPPRWYERFVSGTRKPPAEATYREVPIGEQLAFHPVLADVSQDVYNQLKLAQDWLPQFRPEGGSSQSVLDLRPAVRRNYPFGDVAAHVIGQVGPVSRIDRENDPNKGNPTRRYALVDRIGRQGLEALAEQQLRGTRGTRKTDRSGEELFARDSTPGETVRTTIDIKLQADIQKAFQSVEFSGFEKDASGKAIVDTLPMNGAAVVIDVATGEVRALVSVPSFDLNHFEELYPTLVKDDLNRPLANRALTSALEPGSSVKPIVGLAAATMGLSRASDTVECAGYAVIDGKQVQRPRCWTLSQYGFIHHSQGSLPHPTGLLNLADAVERSCNVYFITEGAKLGIDGLSDWMRAFGLGRETGIGLPEVRGNVPDQVRIPAAQRQSSVYYASVGQGPVNATPIQIANEMATIARDGIWERPRLVPRGSDVPLPTTRPDGSAIADKVDLHLDRDALRSVHTGMFNVVNSPAGTGTHVHSDQVKVAAKTGSATAAQLTRPLRDENGEVVRDAQGRRKFEAVPYGTREHPNPELPWYRASGTDEKGRLKGTHSWVGGYAPADKPRVAFAVYVEYGNSGGVAAASVTRKLVAACVAHGYLTADSSAKSLGPITDVAPVDESMDRGDDDDAH